MKLQIVFQQFWLMKSLEIDFENEVFCETFVDL